MLFGGWEFAGLALGMVLLIVAIYLLRRVTGSLLGPLFLYEMVTLARRGQQLRLRVLLAGFLLVGLFLAYLKEFSVEELRTLFLGTSVQLPMNRQAQFAETFLIAFMAVQLLAVMLITPALTGSAIAEEKERGSLDYLRTTMLTPWEIGMGKFFARLVFLFGVVATGIPVLALAMNQGGMDDRVVFAGYVITLSTAFSLGGWSFYLGTSLAGLREVLLWVYGIVGGLTVFGLCCGCMPGVAVVSPISALVYLFVGKWTSDPNEFGFWLNTLLFAAIHVILGLAFSIRAIFLIRVAAPIRQNPRQRRRKRRDTYYDDDDDDDEDDEEIAIPPPPSEERRPRRPIARRSFRVERVPGTGNPFLWKERYFGGSSSAAEAELSKGCGITVLTIGLFVVGLYLFFAAASELSTGRWSGRVVSEPLRILLTGGVLAMGLVFGVRLAGCVALERQKQTLDSLLTIPVERSEILWGKVLAALYLLRFPGLAMGLAMTGGLLSMGLHPLGLILGTLLVLSYLALLGMFGLWMSTRCKTVTRATVYLLLLTLGLWIGPLLLSPVFDIFYSLIAGHPMGGYSFVVGLSSPVAIRQAFFGWEEPVPMFQTTKSGRFTLFWSFDLLLTGIQFILALVCWMAAKQRFEHEGK